VETGEHQTQMPAVLPLDLAAPSEHSSDEEADPALAPSPSGHSLV